MGTSLNLPWQVKEHPLAILTLNGLVGFTGSYKILVILSLIKLWVEPLSITTISSCDLIVAFTHIVLLGDQLVKAWREISGLYFGLVGDSPSSSLFLSSSSCDLWHLWPGVNFLSQLKQRPWALLLCISSYVSRLTGGKGLVIAIGWLPTPNCTRASRNLLCLLS